METTQQSDVPQPPKQSAYTQSSNPVSRTPVEQRGQQQQQQQQPSTGLFSSSSSTDGGSSSSSQYGTAPRAIKRTANSRPSSDDKLAQREQEHHEKIDSEGKRGHIDLEYGVELQPAEGDIAAAAEGKYNRVQPGAHAGAVGSTPGFEQDTAAQMDRKRAEHDRVLGESGGKSPAYDGEETVDTERRQLRERKLKQNEELDVKGTVKEGTGDPVV